LHEYRFVDPGVEVTFFVIRSEPWRELHQSLIAALVAGEGHDSISFHAPEP
jgi:hypothetical protein